MEKEHSTKNKTLNHNYSFQPISQFFKNKFGFDKLFLINILGIPSFNLKLPPYPAHPLFFVLHSAKISFQITMKAVADKHKFTHSSAENRPDAHCAVLITYESTLTLSAFIAIRTSWLEISTWRIFLT